MQGIPCTLLKQYNKEERDEWIKEGRKEIWDIGEGEWVGKGEGRQAGRKEVMKEQSLEGKKEGNNKERWQQRKKIHVGPRNAGLRNKNRQ